MEFVEGRKFSEVLQSGEDTRPLVEVYFKTAYKMLFIDGFSTATCTPATCSCRRAAAWRSSTTAWSAACRRR